MKWILVSVLFMSSLAWSQGKPSDVVATIGNKKITLEEFNRKYKEVTSQVLVNSPSKKVFLEDLVRYEVGVQEAKRRGLEKDPIVQDRMNQELYKGLLEKELGAKVQEAKVTDAEMRAWYTNNPQIRISDILIDVKPNATAEQKNEARKRANEIYDEVKKSKRPFEELVRLYSDDSTTKSLGGDIGWQSRASLSQPFYAAANALKAGEISTVIEVPFGFHIIKVVGRRSYEDATKREIRMAVFDEKRKVVFDNFFNSIKKQHPINVNSKLLE
ncbi:MAG: peptidylprolyl isomerase [Bdellovibrionaceae bacterium]|nr:peptidylprolyl isomerase [Bdellovibrio sp.]